MSDHKTIAELLGDVSRAAKAVSKDKFNSQQGFKFRAIDDVYDALHPVLAEHGVVTLPQVLDVHTEQRGVTKNGNAMWYTRLLVRYVFLGPAGDQVEAVVIGEGVDMADKAANKALAVAHKYALTQTLQLPTGDPEPEAAPVEAVKSPTYADSPSPRARSPQTPARPEQAHANGFDFAGFQTRLESATTVEQARELYGRVKDAFKADHLNATQANEANQAIRERIGQLEGAR